MSFVKLCMNSYTSTTVQETSSMVKLKSNIVIDDLQSLISDFLDNHFNFGEDFRVSSKDIGKAITNDTKTFTQYEVIKFLKINNYKPTRYRINGKIVRGFLGLELKNNLPNSA